MTVLLCSLGAFDDEDVTHVEGEVDPVRDLEIIHEELRLKDEQYIAKQVVCYCWLLLNGYISY